MCVTIQIDESIKDSVKNSGRKGGNIHSISCFSAIRNNPQSIMRRTILKQHLDKA